MRAQWYLIVFFSCSLLLGGCNNDYRFSHVDHVPSDDDDDGPQPPDPPVTPDPPPHNWPPDVGNVPDLYFAIAWSETPCSWNDSLWADGSQPEQQSDVWAFCDGRNVAVVNMFGEVVDEFTPPDWRTVRPYSSFSSQAEAPDSSCMWCTPSEMSIQERPATLPLRPRPGRPGAPTATAEST